MVKVLASRFCRIIKILGRGDECDHITHIISSLTVPSYKGKSCAKIKAKALQLAIGLPQFMHSEKNFPGIFMVGLSRAIRALESATLTQPEQRFLCNNMATRHHHRRVLISSLLFRDGADKYGVKLICGRQKYFDLFTSACGLCLPARIISTGSSCCVVHSVRFSFIIVCSFNSVGKAMAPAVEAINSGESAESPSREQNSRVKEIANSFQASSLWNI